MVHSMQLACLCNIAHMLVYFSHRGSRGGTGAALIGKLFAMTWRPVRVDTTGKWLVPNPGKEHLKKATEFDKNNWPERANVSLRFALCGYNDCGPCGAGCRLILSRAGQPERSSSRWESG